MIDTIRLLLRIASYTGLAVLTVILIASLSACIASRTSLLEFAHTYMYELIFAATSAVYFVTTLLFARKIER